LAVEERLEGVTRMELGEPLLFSGQVMDRDVGELVIRDIACLQGKALILPMKIPAATKWRASGGALTRQVVLDAPIEKGSANGPEEER
jgi:hypothetical protein